MKNIKIEKCLEIENDKSVKVEFVYNNISYKTESMKFIGKIEINDIRIYEPLVVNTLILHLFFVCDDFIDKKLFLIKCEKYKRYKIKWFFKIKKLYVIKNIEIVGYDFKDMIDDFLNDDQKELVKKLNKDYDII